MGTRIKIEKRNERKKKLKELLMVSVFSIRFYNNRLFKSIKDRNYCTLYDNVTYFLGINILMFNLPFHILNKVDVFTETAKFTQRIMNFCDYFTEGFDVHVYLLFMGESV